MLEWLLDPKLRRRVTAGLNKGKLKNTLSRAVCFNRLGELRDRTFDAQRYRASGLNLVVAAIILWNTVYLDRALAALSEAGRPFDAGWLPHLAPVHWDHINLTGDYSWRQNKRVEKGGFRPMRPTRKSSVLYIPFRQTTPRWAPDEFGTRGLPSLRTHRLSEFARTPFETFGPTGLSPLLTI